MPRKIQDHMAEIKRQKADALAVLRTGGSFDDAARLSGLSVEKVERLWNKHKDKRNG